MDIVERKRKAIDYANEQMMTEGDYQKVAMFAFEQGAASFVAEIERLRAENEALRKNAERYRWLRNWFATGCAVEDSFTDAIRKTSSVEELDAAIDAAMKGE